MRIVFSKRAAEELKKLDSPSKKRVIQKLLWFSRQPNPLAFAHALTDSNLGDYRFRIGNYRVIFDFLEGEILVLKVGHRKDVYSD